MADELLRKFAEKLESLTLVPSDGGKFEVTLDGETLFSKKALHRHAEPGEIAGLVGKHLG